MQKRPAQKKLPRDVNARAFAIGALATADTRELLANQFPAN
jgi:hypothetical protein